MQTISARNPSIPDLWRELRAWLAGALADFGGPAAIASTLQRTILAAIKRRLNLIDSLFLKLLLIEAAHLHPPPRSGGGRERNEREGRVNTTHAPLSLAPLDSSPHSGEHEDPANPETWRVRFRPRIRRFIPRAARHNRRAAAPQRTSNAGSPATTAHKLARRLESLRRAIASPRRAIAALARRLNALGPHARTAAHAIALSRPRAGAQASPALAQAIVRANDASAAFHNTS